MVCNRLRLRPRNYIISVGKIWHNCFYILILLQRPSSDFYSADGKQHVIPLINGEKYALMTDIVTQNYRKT